MTRVTGRVVVLLCGPPGAGKTTLAHQSGLAVYDRDDYPSERAFHDAVAALRTAAAARAVVIRCAATSSARRKTAGLVGATHMYLLTAPMPVLQQRVRGRGRRDLAGTIRGIRRWHERHDRTDAIADFPGWPTVFATPGRTPPPPLDRTARLLAKRAVDRREYGHRHKALRAQWVPLVDAGLVACSRCGQPIAPGSDWHLDHDDNDRTRYRGPSHQRCNIEASNRRSASPAPRPVSRW